MQLTTYLIFILVLVLKAIGLGLTATHLKVSKFLINSRDPLHLREPHQLLLSSFTFKFPLLSHSSTLSSPHNCGPTHLSIQLPIPHFHLHRTQSSSLVSPCTSSYSSSSPALLADFPSMGAAFGVTLHWYALIGVPGVERSATWGWGSS